VEAVADEKGRLIYAAGGDRDVISTNPRWVDASARNVG
jgi:hypothetical protein